MKRILTALGSMLLAAPLGGLAGVTFGLVAGYLKHKNSIDYGAVPVAYWLGGASVGGLGGATVGWMSSKKENAAHRLNAQTSPQPDEEIWPPPPRTL